jgi:hypothetical protein
VAQLTPVQTDVLRCPGRHRRPVAARAGRRRPARLLGHARVRPSGRTSRSPSSCRRCRRPTRPASPQLLDGLALLGFQHQGRAAREGLLGTALALSPEAAIALSTLRGGACMLAHSLVDASGRNPFWPAYGYPGPVVRPPQDPPHVEPYVPADGEVLGVRRRGRRVRRGRRHDRRRAGRAGKSVVVLEAGIATSERDYRQLEVEASTTMMYRNGLSVSADGNIGLLAGATLGGGTTINWHNCVKPSAEVRREWAEHGLADVDTPEFDRHLEAVLARMSANADCSDYNGPHQRMAEGAKALGLVDAHRGAQRRPRDLRPGDRRLHAVRRPERQQARHAADLPARRVRRRRADPRPHPRRPGDRRGRPRHRCRRHVHGPGRRDPLARGARRRRGRRVRGPRDARSAAALRDRRAGRRAPPPPAPERRHLRRLRRGPAAWWGPPQAAVMDEFRDLGDGYGLLVEGSQYYTGVFAFQLARRDGRQAKEAMSKLGRWPTSCSCCATTAAGR